ncbi:MAG TPA: GWxTD domain-containing protein [Clostridia bacterium]|nr:GWxTD domain-containing protein [Clostridia bacterium]
MSFNTISVMNNTITSKLIVRAFACALIFALLSSAMADDVKSMPQRYRDWLQREVTYIITREEKDAFVKLPSDAARDTFIQRFWEIRNPSPGAPSNEFKDEHYRRLAYADQFFGRDAGTPGWRTDKGRIYILFGEPQQKAPYYGLNKVRPMEIWFYQNANHPSLPPYFNILFYKPDSGGDFKLYSPYMDGPQKLVTTDSGSRSEAFKVIDQDAGREVARTTLSLLPDEPVDIDTAVSSLQSDMLLSNIKGLPNLPLEKEMLNRRREVLESVTHRVILGPEFLNAMAVPLRGEDGNVDVHYVLRLQKPEDFTIAQAADGRYYYSLNVTTRVLGPDNKLIFTQETPLSRYFGEPELARMKHKTLAVEGWLPLAPGKYKLEFVLNNKIRQTAFRTATDVAVPEPPTAGLAITQPIPFGDIEVIGPSNGRHVPFSGAGVRFGPMVTQQLELNPTDDLTFFYQIWTPPADPRQNSGKKLIVEYGYGRPGVRGDSKVIRDEVPRDQFDRSGSLLNGKKIPIADLGAGNHRLVVTVTDPETRQKAFSSLNFRVSGAAVPSQSWYVYNTDVMPLVQDGTLDYQRGLCYQANGDQERAAQWFRKAVQKNPRNDVALSKVVSLYFAKKAFAEIAGLYQNAGINGEMDEETILRIAESLDKTGKTQDAVKALESALTLKPPSWPLYVALGSYYKQMGDVQKANELERKGRSLMPAAAAAPTS